MEKRTITAIALSVLVFIAFQWYQQRYMTPPPAQRTAPAAQEAPRPGAPETKAPVPPAEAEPQQAVASPGDTQGTAQRIVVEGDLYRGVIDTRGGLLTAWELKGFQTAQGNVFEMISVVHEAESRPYPGSLFFDDASLSTLVNNEPYEVKVEGSEGTHMRPPATVILTLRRGTVEVEKRYRFEKDNYLVELSAKAQRGGKPLEGRFLLGQDIGPEHEHLVSRTKLQAVYFADGKVHREGPPDDEAVAKIGSNVVWTGLDMQYFTMIAIPPRPLPYFELQKRPVKAVGLDGKQVDRDLVRLTTPMSGSLQYEIYAGPKKQANLEAVRAADITGVIDYGWFSIIVLPLLGALRWIYAFVHNYGYAIIILTFLLSLLLFPFRLKQMVSMKKMQAIQPKVKAIQDKYRRYKKTDPKRAEMNQEIMALYKEHNVNPLGGCLPLLLQFPLLIAFYNMLAYSIELRHAPFILWMQDLSTKDPYYVLPIVMGITMFISQKMTPMTPGADPTQAKVMMVMPVVFTFMFLNMSSGLNLYFLCSNIFQIGFQKIAERWMGGGKPGVASKSS